jgi:hypothetical protein
VAHNLPVNNQESQTNSDFLQMKRWEINLLAFKWKTIPGKAAAKSRLARQRQSRKESFKNVPGI